MARLTTFKDNVKSALNIPRDGFKPRSRRQVISFDEALENLSSSQTGSVTCGAFNSFGRCRKQITLGDAKLLANLDRFDKTDIQTPIKLMPLMLCPSHWRKTIYYNALFLDWVSAYGSKRDDIHFESIVVDYQSAIVIDNNENSCTEVAISSGVAEENRGRSISAPGSRINNRHLSVVNTVAQPQTDVEPEESSPCETSYLESEPDLTAQMPPGTALVASLESFASIELGVVNLEILYQEDLKCIAMTSNGWRCPKDIHQEELLQARHLLSSSATFGSELDTELLPRLVLCPGHARGSLPRIYSDKWAAFSQQRLPKDEAMSKFNADFWMSVEFFPDDRRQAITFRPKSPNRPRSASALPAHHRQKSDSKITAAVGDNLVRPHTGTRLELHTHKFEFNLIQAPVVTIVQSVDEKIESGTSPSQGSGETIEKSFPLEQDAGTRVSLPKAPTTLHSSHGIGRRVSQAAIDRAIMREIVLPVPSKGYVHIFKSTDSKLYRIGNRANTHHPRPTQDSGDIKVKSIRTEYPERVIKLVHLELQNFRSKFEEGGEWFNVTESVALLSVYTWCNFVSNAYETDGAIKKTWAGRLILLPKPSSKEIELLERVLGDEVISNRVKHSIDYHDERYQRYNVWIREGTQLYC